MNFFSGGCIVRKTLGYMWNPLTNRWSWSDGHDINYITHAVKTDAHEERAEYSVIELE